MSDTQTRIAALVRKSYSRLSGAIGWLCLLKRFVLVSAPDPVDGSYQAAMY